MCIREFVVACILLVVLWHLAFIFNENIFGIILMVLLVIFGFIAPWFMFNMMLTYEPNDAVLFSLLYLLFMLIIVGAVAFTSKKHALRNIIIAEMLITSIFIAITYPHFNEKVFTEKGTSYVTIESSDQV